MVVGVEALETVCDQNLVWGEKDDRPDFFS